MSSRITRIEGVEPVTLKQAEGIPGFADWLMGTDLKRNYKSRGVPWDVVGQFLIRVWRDGLAAQLEVERARITTEAERRAKQDFMARVAEVIGQPTPQATAKRPKRRKAETPKRKRAGGRRRR